MMKFFRKYNKQLLAFFMALLMIVFIGGSALEGLLRPDPNFQYASSNLGVLTQQDQRIAAAETNLLSSMGHNWQHPLFSDNDPITETDWVLLSREAKKLGIEVDAISIETSPVYESRMDDIRKVAHNMRVKPETVIAALAKLQTIRQAAMAMAAAAAPGEAEVLKAARDSLERVKTRAVILPAEAFVDHQATFTDQQIKEQFDKYRERERGAGIQFGYYRKPGIKVQYIKIDRDAIAANLKIPNEDRRAKAYYEEHREKDPVFRRKPEELVVHDPPVGPPAPKPTTYMDWEQARDIATAELRKDMADENVERIAKWFYDSIIEPWVGVQPAKSGYKPAPKEVAEMGYYLKLIERLPPSLHFPNAVTVQVTDFFTQQDAAKVPELGSLSVRSAGALTARSFGSVAFANEAIVPAIPEDEKVSAGDYLSLFQTATPLNDSRSGNAYIFRVVESKPGGPAESFEVVRDEVVADLRLATGFEKARQRAESLRTCCMASEPLKDAYEADSDLASFRESGEGAKTGYFEPPPFSRIGQGPAWKERPMDGVFVGGGLGKLPNHVVDAIFALEHAPEKLAVFELPDRAAVMVVEWLETVPPQEEEFADQRKSLVQQLTDNRWRDFVNDWFDPRKIRARNGFEFVRNR